MKILVVGGVVALRRRLLHGPNVHVKFVTCGRKGCRCKVGERHGPYYYIRHRTDKGRYRDEYVKSASVAFELEHETIGETDLLINVNKPIDLPETFNDCPMFVVTRRLSSHRVEGSLEPS